MEGLTDLQAEAIAAALNERELYAVEFALRKIMDDEKSQTGFLLGVATAGEIRERNGLRSIAAKKEL